MFSYNGFINGILCIIEKSIQSNTIQNTVMSTNKTAKRWIQVCYTTIVLIVANQFRSKRQSVDNSQSGVHDCITFQYLIHMQNEREICFSTKREKNIFTFRHIQGQLILSQTGSGTDVKKDPCSKLRISRIHWRIIWI